MINIDNLSTELPYVMDKVSHGKYKVKIPTKTSLAKRSKSTILADSSVSEQLFRQVSAIYKNDYEMFGFEYPDPLF